MIESKQGRIYPSIALCTPILHAAPDWVDLTSPSQLCSALLYHAGLGKTNKPKKKNIKKRLSFSSIEIAVSSSQKQYTVIYTHTCVCVNRKMWKSAIKETSHAALPGRDCTLSERYRSAGLPILPNRSSRTQRENQKISNGPLIMKHAPLASYIHQQR